MSKLVTFSGSLVFLISSQLGLAQPQAPSAAEFDWRSRSQLPEAQRAKLPYYCSGAYLQPASAQTSTVGSTPLSASQINADAEHVLYEADYKITLTGDVRLSQGHQEVKSPKIVQDNTSHISVIEGPLSIREEGLLLTGEHAVSNMAEGTGTVYQATFLLHESGLRGSAAKLEQAANGHILLDDATLTRCEPGSNAWELKGEDIELEPEKGFGTARNLTVRVKGVPIFYTPYLRFPINDERQSGFLLPNIGFDSDGGTDLNIPYYFNFNPQYDATYQLRSMFRRGLIHDTQFRYKSKRSNNEINMAFLLKDDIYDGRAINDRTSPGTDTSSQSLPPFEKQDRWLLNLRHDGGWDSRWKTHLSYSAVSDVDYLHDIGGDVGSDAVEAFLNPVASSLTNRRSAALERIARVQYRGDNWNAELGFHGFQSLVASGSSQYEKLPELKLNWARAYGPVEFKSRLNYAFFERRNTASVVGERAYIDLEAGLPMRNVWGFFEPKVGLIHRKYQLDDTLAGARANPEITTGRFSIDTGLYFDRDMSWGSGSLQQTLEPRLFYLYVEEDDQNDLPGFDAGVSTLSYNAIFRANRFSGYDRIGDANQISLGLTSRILSANTGAEFLSVSIGQIYYLRDRTVLFRATAADDPNAGESALFTEARLNLKRGLSVTGALEWEPRVNRTNRGSFSLKYHSADNKKLFNVNYIYTSEDIQPASLQRKSEESNINLIWPIRGNWNFVGMWNFGWDDNRTIESFYGLEYNDCCWKTRLVIRRFLKQPRFVSALVDDPTSPTGFSEVTDFVTPADTGIFFEFQLKGLATLGRRLDSLLEDAIPGYRAREANAGL